MSKDKKPTKAEEPEDFKIEDIPDDSLDEWVKFVAPEEDVSKLNRKEKEDIWLAFQQELMHIAKFIGERQAETKYPDRLYSRILLQMGTQSDEQITQLQKKES